MRISDWSSDVCSSDLWTAGHRPPPAAASDRSPRPSPEASPRQRRCRALRMERSAPCHLRAVSQRSEEHTSELQSLMRISYAVFCLKKKNHNINTTHNMSNNINQITRTKSDNTNKHRQL